MSLYTAVNGAIKLQLANAYTSGSGTMVLKSGQGASLGGTLPVRITLITNASYGLNGSEVTGIYGVTAISGDTLTVSAIDGTTDTNWSVNDYVECRCVANYINNLNALCTTFIASGSTHTVGLVPDPGSTSHASPYLLGDNASWIQITGSGVSYSGGVYTISGSGSSAAGSLTGTTLASNVVNSSLTTFGSSIVLGTPASGNLANCTFPTLNQNTTGTAANVTGTVAIANGGTGQITAAAAYNALSPMTTLGDIEFESGANTAARLAGNTSATKKFLSQTGTGTVSASPSWATISTSDLPTVGPANGGTGLTSLTAHAVMLGEGTSNVAFAAIGTAGRVLVDQGASTDPAFETISGDATFAATGALTVTKTNGVAFAASATTDTTVASNIATGNLAIARMPSIAAYSTIGNNTSSTASPTAVQSLILGTPSITDTGILEQLTASGTSYEQVILQNTSNASGASTDLVINNDQGTSTTHYLDVGVNSSGFSGSGSFNVAGAGYVYMATGDLAIGTLTSNAVHFVINNGSSDAMTIGTDGGVTIGAPTGGDKGSGTLNATGLYVNGTAVGGTYSPNVQEFTSNGTWTKPTGASIVRVVWIGGGGGGGGGGIQPSGTAASGGGGGGGAGFGDIMISATDLASTVSVTVGSAGTAGAAVSGTTAASGGAGGNGGNTSFGTYLIAGGGLGGGGGGTGNSNGGGLGWGFTSSGVNGAGCTAGAVGGGLTNLYTSITCGGGASGGGVNASAVGQGTRLPYNFNGSGNPASANGLGGGATGTGGASPTAGGAGGSYQGTSYSNSVWCGWGGGGGGGASSGVSAGAGGVGGGYGGGGGGGGAAVTGASISSGAGGAGGGGFLVVYSW